MRGELEYRTASQVGIDWPTRTITLIVMPYESPTEVFHKGRVVTEVCSRGAYDGIEKRPNRVAVNRDHDLHRTVGRAVTFFPSREEGLVAEVRISKSVLGDETLALADDDVLDSSAGFGVSPGGETWEQSRTVRRLNKVWLDHIAMTPDPAYLGAKVLSVRDTTPPEAAGSERTATPFLDKIRMERLAAQYGLGS